MFLNAQQVCKCSLQSQFIMNAVELIFRFSLFMSAKAPDDPAHV